MLLALISKKEFSENQSFVGHVQQHYFLRKASDHFVLVVSFPHSQTKKFPASVVQNYSDISQYQSVFMILGYIIVMFQSGSFRTEQL